MNGTELALSLEVVIGGRNIWDSLGSGELEKDITSWLSLTWNTIVI